MQPKAYSRSVGMLEAFAVVPIGMCGAKARRLNFTVPSASRKVAGLSSTDQPHQWDAFANSRRLPYDGGTSLVICSTM